MSDDKRKFPPISDAEAAELEHITQAMGYYAGDLAGAEKAAFEAHLATCARCQKWLADAPKVLADLAALGPVAPTFTPKHTVEEQVARFDALVAEERSQRRALWLRWAVAAVVLVALGVLTFTLAQPPKQKMLSAPVPPPAATTSGR